MQVTAEYLGQARFDVRARGHHLFSDQPVDNGGEDSGMTPPEFLLGAIASCVGYYAAKYLETRKLPADELQVSVSAEKVPNPARLGAFRVEITAPNLDERHRDGILRAAHSCLVHNTLSVPNSIDIRLDTGEHATLESRAIPAIGPTA